MFDLEACVAPRKTPRQERSRALVEAIVEAGTRILVRRGREAVTTNSVAAVAGVSIGSLYQYFPNREAIIAAVAGRHAQRIHDRIATVDIAGARTLDTAIVSIVDALFDSHFLEPQLHIALVHDLEAGTAEGVSVVAAKGAKSALVDQLLRLPHHFEDCDVDGDLSCAAFVIAEMTHALAHAAIHPSHQPFPVADLKNEAVRVSLSYLRQSSQTRANIRVEAFR
jgi:AcrR family transcriptional regulator